MSSAVTVFGLRTVGHLRDADAVTVVGETAMDMIHILW